ncbi:MAG: hypothetical protein NTV44_04035 [Firmicutes bacterium]|nr:hypothetical protein [Bacillota bacterium]
MEKLPVLAPKKNEAPEKKKNYPLLLIGLISLIFDILLALLFFYWRYSTTHLTYEVLSSMTITDTVMPEGYSTTGEVHYSAGTDGYVQFTALNQRLDTPSFGSHSAYEVSFDVTSFIYYSDESYDSMTPTFTVVGYDSAGQPIQTVHVYIVALGTMNELSFATSGIDHFVFFHTGPACSLEQTEALAGIGHIVIEVPKEVSL